MNPLVAAAFLLLFSAESVTSQHIPLTLLDDWPTGFKFLLSFQVPQNVRGGWKMTMKFSKPIQPELQAPNAMVKPAYKDTQVFCLWNRQYNKDIRKGETLRMDFIGKKLRSNEAPPTATVDFHPGRGASCNMAPPHVTPAPQEIVGVELLETWPNGFKFKFSVVLLQPVRGGWNMIVTFSLSVLLLQTPRAIQKSHSADRKVYHLVNRPYNANLEKCQLLDMTVIGLKRMNAHDPTVEVEFNRKEGSYIGGNPVECATTAPPTPPPSTPTTAVPSTAVPSEVVGVELLETWPNGFKFKFSVVLLQPVRGGWDMTVTFSLSVSSLQTPRAIQKSLSADRKVYRLVNRPYNANLEKCQLLDMTVIGLKRMNAPDPTVEVEFNRKEGSYIEGNPAECATTAPHTPPPPTPTPPPQPTTSPSAPSTAGPSTSPPSTAVTRTSPPSTAGSTTSLPPTDRPNTSPPSTAGPSTSVPSTVAPSTPESSPSGPSTAEPTTAVPSTAVPSAATTVELSTLHPTTAGTIPPLPFDYDEVLHDSILFYEAQRSGKLPANNRIPWRRDSALDDRGENGEDLTGGWYDAGDYVKFGFPMASSVTVLSWGLVEYRHAYQAAGELNKMLDCIKWPLDYFIKAHKNKFEFYGQVGDGHKDHSFWGRPEDMTMARPAFKITTAKPGSELAAETAAAMAAASIAFKQTDPSYASTLLKHAEELYEFADKYHGKYSDAAIPNAGSFYRSSHIEDELVWGAAWLYRANNKAEYLIKAERYYKQFGMNGKPWAFSWDDKKAGAQLLLAVITGKESYEQDVKAFLDSWLPGHDVIYTPKGLAWRDTWGPNRYSANSAFLALVAADHGINSNYYREFARNQIHYMLGDGGRSYVVGFGNNPPKRPHHRSSSCPLVPEPCDWGNQDNAGPNPHVLLGALVGGPGKNDDYVDDRKDYVKNEVATDYNAGFQSAVAGLKHLVIGNDV